MPGDVPVPIAESGWGGFWLDVMERWGLCGEEISYPNPGGMLGGLRMGLLVSFFSSLHLEVAVYFNFQNIDVTAWKTGKAKLADSSPSHI